MQAGMGACERRVRGDVSTRSPFFVFFRSDKSSRDAHMRDARWEQRQMSRESWLKTNPEMSLASLDVQASGIRR